MRNGGEPNVKEWVLGDWGEGLEEGRATQVGMDEREHEEEKRDEKTEVSAFLRNT